MMLQLSVLLPRGVGRRISVVGFAIVSFCFLMSCENAHAQMRVRTSHSAGYTRQTQTPQQRAQHAQPVTAVPDFWADSGHATGATLSNVDRLDRENLGMLYHFSYESRHQNFPNQNAWQSPEPPGRKSLIHRFSL